MFHKYYKSIRKDLNEYNPYEMKNTKRIGENSLRYSNLHLLPWTYIYKQFSST